jgi:hypothetical protein
MPLFDSRSQVSPSDVIAAFTRLAAPRLEARRRRLLLLGTSALRIPIASAALALGVALSGEARAQATVNPVQTTTYTIQSASNPITFGPTTTMICRPPPPASRPAPIIA